MSYIRTHSALMIGALALTTFAVQGHAQSLSPVATFPLSQDHGVDKASLVIDRPVQPAQPFTVAGPRGVLVGTQDGSFESWIMPVKLLSHFTIEAQIENYPVPIPLNPQAAQIEVRPDHTTITYAHTGFTVRQIMFSPIEGPTGQGPVVLFQIESIHPVDFTFRFAPEMRWMWPRRNDGTPDAEWIPPRPPAASNTAAPSQIGQAPASAAQPTVGGFYMLHLDYNDLAGAVAIPTALPGIMAPYQERPREHPLELKLHYDPTRDRGRFYPLLMAVGTTPELATEAALARSLEHLNASIAQRYAAHLAYYQKMLADATSIETPDPILNQAFSWGVISIEQLRAHAYVDPQPSQIAHPETALVAGYYASGDSARPGFGWFFGRDALYTLYAINGFGDFALTRDELNFLIARQRDDGKIMHEYSQTASVPSVNWKSFPYMYAAADATPLFLMAVRDYYRASGDLAFLKANREAIEKAWSFETAASSDSDHDGIFDNSQGTGWVESWPGGTATASGMPRQEIYLALLDAQASQAYARLEKAFGNDAKADEAGKRASTIQTRIESEYYDAQKGCYAFATNPAGMPNSPVDHTATVYPSIAWWDDQDDQVAVSSPLAHGADCLRNFAAAPLDTDWGTRDVADNEHFYDGMSYHQGSVWPLFTGWAALAEYRGNQPLSGEQLLMQNVDLTWAQDPGAVTELLSGDFFVPMGRSTSHQLWSSAMVLTPTLRGLFGISLDAATNTITINPHLPASWNHAEINNLHLGDQIIDLHFGREKGMLWIGGHVASSNSSSRAILPLKMRSDLAGAKIASDPKNGFPSVSIPLPSLEIELSEHRLPAPGSKPAQLKVLSTNYGANQLFVQLSAPAGSQHTISLVKNRPLPNLKIDSHFQEKNPGAKAGIDKALIVLDGKSDPLKDGPVSVAVDFPAGEGWKTVGLTLFW